jgi:hypothetical protein
MTVHYQNFFMLLSEETRAAVEQTLRPVAGVGEWTGGEAFTLTPNLTIVGVRAVQRTVTRSRPLLSSCDLSLAAAGLQGS